MFAYNIKLALKSMRRNSIMTALMIAAIAVGIGVSMTTLTVHYLMSGNPIPSKSDVLFAVTMDNWDPLRPFDEDYPERAPQQAPLLRDGRRHRPLRSPSLRAPVSAAPRAAARFVRTPLGGARRSVPHTWRLPPTAAPPDAR